MHEGGVKTGRHADGLGEDGGDAVAADAVEADGPIIVSRQAQARNGGRLAVGLHGLLLEGHPADQIMDARVQGLGRVAPEREAVGGGCVGGRGGR